MKGLIVVKENIIKTTWGIINDINKSRNMPDCKYTSLGIECTKMLWTYILSCKWNDTRRVRDIVGTMRLSSAEAAKSLGISANTVRSTRSKINDKLHSILGNDIFDIIRFGNEKQQTELLMKLNYLLSGYSNADNFVPEIVIDKIFEKGAVAQKSYELKELKNELIFLAKYDVINMMRTLDVINEDKLRYILQNLRYGTEDEKMKFMICIFKFEEKIKEKCL